MGPNRLSTTPAPDSGAAGLVARYQSLDIWRGVACLLVIAIHSLAYVREGLAEPFHGFFHSILTVLHRGWAGVPMFFVISGYCIAAAVESSRARGQSISSYFYRRFRRIYPPYWLWLLCATTVFLVVEICIQPGFFDKATMVTDPRHLSGWQWLGNLTLTESWRSQVIGDATSYLLTPAWTLCYEEQFYACAGLALLLSARTSFFQLAVAVTLLTLVVLGSGLLFGVDARRALMGFFLDGAWLMFASGILVYYAVARASLQHRRILLGVLLIALLVTLRRPSILWTGRDNDFTLSCAIAFAFAILLVILHRHDRAIYTARALGPLQWCGVRCYSIYLVHWPIVNIVSKLLSQTGLQTHARTLFVTVPLCTAAALLAGWIFHATVERRFLNTPQGSSAAGTPAAA